MARAITLLDLPEEPDVLDELSQLATLEAATLDLEMVMGDIDASGGVSSRIVEPVRHLLPESVNPRSFTQNPSQTNLKVTMEALDAKTVILIGAAVVAVGLFMTKIVKWLKDLYNRTFGNTRKASKAVEQLYESNSKLKRIEAILTADTKREYEALRDTMVEPHVKGLADLWNPGLKDVLDEGSMTRALVNSKRYFETLQGEMVKSVKILKGYSGKSFEGREAEATNAVLDIESAILPKHDHDLRATLSGILRISTSGESSLEDMKAISDEYRRAWDTPMSVGFNAKNALHDAERIRVGSAAIDKIDMTSELNKLESAIKSMESLKFKPALGRDVEAAIRKATSSLRQHVDILRMYVTMVCRAINMRNVYVMQCQKVSSAMVRAMVSAIVNSNDDTAKAELRKINTKD